VQAALIEAGLRSGEFTVVPFPINLPELYRYYVPLDVRRRMARGEPWEHVVPPSTAELLTRWGIAERIRRLLGDV